MAPLVGRGRLSEQTGVTVRGEGKGYAHRLRLHGMAGRLSEHGTATM